MKKSILEKLTSRKFIVTVITAIAGIVTMIVGENEVVNIIVGAVMTILPTIIYCIMEGTIDAKTIKTISDTAADTVEKLGVDEKVVDVIEQVGELGEILTDTENTSE